jgi:hypothetical protein
LNFLIFYFEYLVGQVKELEDVGYSLKELWEEKKTCPYGIWPPSMPSILFSRLLKFLIFNVDLF